MAVSVTVFAGVICSGLPGLSVTTGSPRWNNTKNAGYPARPPGPQTGDWTRGGSPPIIATSCRTSQPRPVGGWLLYATASQKRRRKLSIWKVAEICGRARDTSVRQKSAGHPRPRRDSPKEIFRVPAHDMHLLHAVLVGPLEPRHGRSFIRLRRRVEFCEAGLRVRIAFERFLYSVHGHSRVSGPDQRALFGGAMSIATVCSH
jgi:hypothetical protein